MLIATLLAVAEKQPPLIDIDATVFIQFAIFLVMAGVLTVFVFKPYLKVQEQRSTRIDGARADAKAMQERAATLVADYEEKLTRAKQRGAEERNRLRAEGQAHEREVLGKARDIAQKALREAQAKAEAERVAARGQLLAQASTIAQRIAARILGREI